MGPGGHEDRHVRRRHDAVELVEDGAQHHRTWLRTRDIADGDRHALPPTRDGPERGSTHGRAEGGPDGRERVSRCGTVDRPDDRRDLIREVNAHARRAVGESHLHAGIVCLDRGGRAGHRGARERHDDLRQWLALARADPGRAGRHGVAGDPTVVDADGDDGPHPRYRHPSRRPDRLRRERDRQTGDARPAPARGGPVAPAAPGDRDGRRRCLRRGS